MHTINRVKTTYAVPAVGETAIYPAPEYAGSVVKIKRGSLKHFTVTASRTLKDGARAAASVWHDYINGGYVVDYWEHAELIEVDRTHSVEAALNIAVASVSERGREDGWW